jgi:multisubunit Na+/H+ antiporter MnhB subunit
MTIPFAFDIGTAMLLIAVGGWMMVAPGTMVAVIIFVVYGLLMAIAWVRLSAVDVALTEAAIGSGITGMLLLSAAARLRQTEVTSTLPSFPIRLLSGVLCAAITSGLAVVVLLPADVAPTLAPMAMANLPETGLGNPVAGVLFAFRALDTLLEKVVLLLALLGVWSLAPDRLWGGVPALDSYAPPNDILVFFAQVLPPFGIVFAIYMTWTGASNPGGAFQGGTVLAVMWLLVMMAGVVRAPPISCLRLRWLLVAGPVLFLMVGLAGFALAAGFLAYPAGYAKPLIVVVEIGLALSIGATLGLLAAGPPERNHQP